MNPELSIMIVDDDESILDVLRQSLSAEGFRCEAFQHAEDALNALGRAPVDVLLTDIVLPGMPGLELVTRAKNIQPSLTVIVMTGFVEDFSYDEAIHAGAADFIKKPFTAGELLVRIKHARFQEHLRELSITDELTGLTNRRGFFSLAQQQIKMVRREGEHMVLLYADLDNLKAVNDTGGHLAGDRLLAGAAEIFRETFRDSDIIARIGGDEFAVLLIRASQANVQTVNTRIQKRIDEYNARRDGTPMLSISTGLAVFDPSHPRSIDELIREADTRMYEKKQQKKEGRSP